MGVKNLSLYLLILFSIFTISTSADRPECIYGIYVQTGTVPRAGTHSVISLTLSDEFAWRLEIPNLEDWGLMGPGHNYFETGQLDIFGGKGPCLAGQACGLNLTSDGSGPYHAWYCDYVKVVTFGVEKECSQEHFAVNQWLSKDPPYKLSTAINKCIPRMGINGLRSVVVD
ncbi:hypothetical protein CDL12_00478 [Handroanthus impetiginosus]|uniref:PLAT domain-containing protein n=1 Tax=Handroanthus impetiginosus TaxID=429701 RepID=A0A2G9IAJ2_9LAMI|nr:hypothetical protein CDL12_00478 [Handroanthus impetiginosus]